MKKLLNKIPFYKLPMRIKIWWAEMLLRMFRGFGETFNNDIVLFTKIKAMNEELELWIKTGGRPSTSNADYIMNTMNCYYCERCFAMHEEECVCKEFDEEE